VRRLVKKASRCHAILGGVFHNQIAHGFRRYPSQQRCKKERHPAAPGEEHAPAILGKHLGRNDATHRGPDGETAEHQGHEGRTALFRAVLRCDRDGRRHGAAESQAREETQPAQRLQTGAERCHQAGAAKNSHRDHQHRLPAVAVGQRTDGKGADHQPKKACGEEQPQPSDLNVPLRSNRGRDEADDRSIEAIDGDDEEAQEQQKLLHGR
jgi:hypothetical protein